ncbi:MAG: hypothetical protein Q8L66_05135 [Caulobacter sp.]|nr:hypothetical protein [Caulobacter sp.]
MKRTLISGLFALVAVTTAGAANAGGSHDPYGPPPPSGPPADCLCTRSVVFYGPTAPYGNINVRAPGVRVYGTPISVPTGRIDIQGPPVYVDAPPIHIQAPQIYLQRPQVYVRPSNVTVDPPEIHFVGCADGERCEPVP